MTYQIRGFDGDRCSLLAVIGIGWDRLHHECTTKKALATRVAAAAGDSRSAAKTELETLVLVLHNGATVDHADVSPDSKLSWKRPSMLKQTP